MAQTPQGSRWVQAYLRVERRSALVGVALEECKAMAEDHPTPSDDRIEQAASIMFAAALAFTDNIGKIGLTWQTCGAEKKNYWRNIARITQKVLNDP
jgi:hypothetical protein